MQCYDIANVIAMIEDMINFWVGPIGTLLFPLGYGTVQGHHLYIYHITSL